MSEKGFPWISLILIVLCSFSFEYNVATSAFNYDGMSIAMIVLGIISILFTFKITGKMQDVLLSHKLMSRKITSKYEKLLPFIIIIPAIGYTALGERLKGMEDKFVPAWKFQWGQSEQHIWVILLFLLFLLLHRVVLILQEIEKTKRLTNQ